MSERNPPLPVTFRTELISRLMPRLRAGECCSLVGASGVGKSTLPHFLRQRDVQESYWQGDLPWVIAIDSNGVIDDGGHGQFALTEMLLHRLLLEAEERGAPDELTTWLDDRYTHLVHEASGLLGLRYLERACARLRDRYGCQLIFVFDQFEDIWQSMPPSLFRSLRFLRDSCKYYVAYVLITRERLQRTRPDQREVESFAELFSPHVFGIGMYGERDTRTALARLGARGGIVLDDGVVSELTRLSGGHPALLRALFWAFTESGTLPTRLNDLISIPAVAEPCMQIWNDLALDEQQLARFLAHERPQPRRSAEALAEMQLKELVNDAGTALFSPLFRQYVLNQTADHEEGVVVDARRRQVWVDGERVETPVLPKAFALIELLARHAGQVCGYEEIQRQVWPEDQSFSDNADQRLDNVLNRLRNGLGERGRGYVIRHPKVGIQLTKGRLQP